MVLNLLAMLFVFAITFVHSIFGFFSGLINVFCTIVALVVSLGTYEAVNNWFTATTEMSPSYAEPLTLVFLFCGTLILLRTLADNYIKGNVHVPMALDWGGAAVCGFVNAQVAVGVMVIGVTMLPIGGAPLGYARYERVQDERDPDHSQLIMFKRRNLWLRSDEFAAGLFSMLSGGSLEGSEQFAEVYPDYVEAVWFSTNTVQAESSPTPHRGKSDGFKNGLAVETWWEASKLDAAYREDVPSERNAKPALKALPFEPASSKKLLAFRLTLKQAAAERTEKTNNPHLFRPTMIRLVGEIGTGASARPVQYTPIALLNADPEVSRWRIVDYDNNFSVSGGDVKVDAAFEVDAEFRPTFIEYRRHARAAVSGAMAEAAPDAMEQVVATREEGPGGGEGRRSFGSVLGRGSGDTANLPVEISIARAQSNDVELDGSRFVKGRLFGQVSRLKPGQGDTELEGFKIPAGQRIVQIAYKPKEARTVVGNVFNFVGQLNQYTAMDDRANTYTLAGYYAIVKRGNEEYIELFFNGDPDDPYDPAYRGMLDFKNINRRDIAEQDDAQVGLLFVVRPGVRVKRIENQGGDGVDVNLKTNDRGG